MPTIKEVADRAGVAVGTVSHVINGSVPVSDSLRRKVQAAIRELDYHPNHVARSLKTSRTRTLGIIVPDMTIPYFPRVIRGAEAAARLRDYSLIAVNSDDNPGRQKELLSLLRSQRVEGILLAVSAGPTPLAQINRIISAGIRVVCVDRIPDRLPVDSVSVEDVSAAEMAIHHLLAVGHERIAIVTGPLTLKNERQRLLGYHQALESRGRQADASLIWEGNILTDDVTAMCRERLCGRVRRPDAIFATNGPTGLGVLRAIYESGLRTPEDVALVTFDELTVDDLFRPAVTTVVQPAYDIGYRAAEILLTRIEGGEDAASEPVTLRLPAALKVRDSSRFSYRAVSE
ncbi:MAG: LacI family DNA-binding transcriptional regulator [Acidobacteriota bacterium]|nr:LacI family DNA-binding transcriptional regulator [Acidobacteriota bacterium]